LLCASFTPTSRQCQTGCLSFGSLLTTKFLGRLLAFAIALEVVIQSPSFGSTLIGFSRLEWKNEGSLVNVHMPCNTPLA
jgi:hypothetical protein